ncbi:MAG: carboxypeptidase regulatory-like domain-containing protein [Planctomycetes bacterium]|nr:carboxypeptidase regulatory-like domain-containing protein [Planctomycetota bacterium]
MPTKNIVAVCLTIIAAILIGCSNNTSDSFKWTVCGRVVGPKNQPVPDVPVYAYNGGGYQTCSDGPPKVIPWKRLAEQYPTPSYFSTIQEYTDKNGEFNITLESPVNGLVIVRHPDYLQVEKYIEPNRLRPDNTIDIGIIALDSGASVTGVVTGTDGTPARNVDVGLYQRDISYDEYIRLVKTDKQGRYIIKGLPDGKYALAAWDEYSTPCEKEIDIKKSDKPAAIDFTLQLGGTLTVLVQNRVDDSLVPGYAVYLEPRVPSGFTFRPTDAKYTNLIGKATFDGLEDREYWILVVPPDQLHAVGHILPWPPFSPHYLLKDEASVTIKVDPAIALKGRIIDANTSQPVREFRITALPDGKAFDKTYGNPWEINSDTITSPSGEFIIDGFRPGRWLLRLNADGYIVPKDGFSVDIPVGGLKDKLEISLNPGTGKINGTVLDAQTGNPLAGVKVNVYEWDGRPFGASSLDTLTDTNGVFSFNTLLGNEFPLTIRVDKRGYVKWEIKFEQNKRPAIIEPIQLEYVCTLKGRYLDANGQPVPGAKIILAKGEGRGKTYHLPQTTTKADGSFEITDIPKGEYFVHYHDKKEPVKFTKPGEVVSVVLK